MPFVVALAAFVAGGLGAVLFARRPRASSLLGALGALTGCLVGLVPAVRVLMGVELPGVGLPWPAPFGAIVLAVDPLSAFFMVPLFVVGALAAIYGHGYLAVSGAPSGGDRHAAPRSLAVPWLAYDLLLACMLVVLLARDGLQFLVAWELMALAAYLLVSWDHAAAEVRRAGWVYLIASHAATALLVALFLTLGRRAGGLGFAALMQAPAPRGASLVAWVTLAAVGFGVKAGFVPLHVWLPEAHAAAPSHVSAVMSAVLVKVGLYGLLRALSFLGPPATWLGPSLMVLGLVGALVGIALAVYQRDLKRALAYSTVENVGVVTLGLGVGFWAHAHGRPDIAAIGLAGGLLHVWNHALMKGTLFLAAGSVLHGCGTKDLERLGGLMKRMPFTGAAMALGATAIAALPPLNGFVSEWLVYMSLIRAGVDERAGIVPLLSVGLLSLVGGVTALAFVRLAGTVLLGTPRSEQAARAHESGPLMTVPLWVLAGACATLGVVPALLLPVLARVADQLVGAPLPRLEPALLWSIGGANAGVWLALAATALVVARLARRRPSAAEPTWGCGYAAPSARMQYTASSFAQIATGRLLPAFLAPRVARPALAGPVAGPARLASDCTDPVTRAVYEPLLDRWARRFARLRWMQQGMLHAYLGYLLVALVVGLGWASVRTWIGP